MRTAARFLVPVGLVVFGISGLACGGASETGPGPLQHQFDDMHIAAIPLDAKQAMMQAQNDYSVAKMARAKAAADYRESGTQLEIARNERAQALLSEKSAGSAKRAADESNDMNRVNASAAAMRYAELARKAADVKVDYQTERRSYLKKWLRYQEEETYARQAKYEMAKAQLALSNNIRPKGFEFLVYEQQYKTRSQRAQRAQAIAQADSAQVEQTKLRWQALETAAKSRSTDADTAETAASGDGDKPNTGDGGSM